MQSTPSRIASSGGNARPRASPLRKVGRLSGLGPGYFMVGWGQAGHKLWALKNSLQASRSRLAGQQTARGGEGTLLFLECQPVLCLQLRV